MGTEDVTPWFTQYCHQYSQSVGPSNHEYFNIPSCVLVVLSSQEKQLVENAKSLYKSNAPPAGSFPEGQGDPSVPVRYILLHDDHEGPTQAARDRLAKEMIPVLGQELCQLVKINSLDSAEVDMKSGIVLQTFLSGNDWSGINKFVEYLITKVVVGHIQQSFSELKQKV